MYNTSGFLFDDVSFVRRLIAVGRLEWDYSCIGSHVLIWYPLDGNRAVKIVKFFVVCRGPVLSFWVLESLFESRRRRGGFENLRRDL